MSVSELRTEIDELIAAGESAEAARRLAELWREASGPAAASFVVSRYERLRGRVPLRPYRLAVLRSFTVEPLVPLLRAACFHARIDLTVHLGDFNAYAQEMLDVDSALYRFDPDACLLAVQTRDIAPDLWHDYARLADDERRAAVNRVAESFADLVRAFRRQSRASLVVHTLEEPPAPAAGILDAQESDGQASSVRQINEELRRAAASERGVYLLDYDALVARHGRVAWHDERKWLAARLPFAASSLMPLVNEWMRFLHPLAGRVAKVVAVDLDNTLWGGVVGEDGLSGIQLGAEHPGAAYLEVQRALLDLRRRGVLLCVCSKNNPDEALEALDHHPSMLLRRDDFAAVRINWDDKAHNLRALAAELSVGTDSLAFLDDNPVEREHVRRELPEAWVVELPRDAYGFARAVRECPVFERLTLSDEDTRRAALYAEQGARRDAERGHRTREDFLRDLRQEAEVARVTPDVVARVAQLTQKTNQFNLTTRRYTEQQIEGLARRGDARVYALRVRDRFGDNGLVGIAITVAADGGRAWEMDTFLLSCRVIGRTVETALLAHVADEARAAGVQELRGRFLPTKKNAPAREFYPTHGFVLVSEGEAGASLWGLDLARTEISCPEWIRLTVAGGEKV